LLPVLSACAAKQGPHQLLIALFAGAEHFYTDKIGMVALLLDEAAGGVPDERQAAGHARTEGGTRRPENEHRSTGHVLAGVVAHTFDDGGGAGVNDEWLKRVAHSRKFPAVMPGCANPVAQ